MNYHLYTVYGLKNFLTSGLHHNFLVPLEILAWRKETMVSMESQGLCGGQWLLSFSCNQTYTSLIIGFIQLSHMITEANSWSTSMTSNNWWILLTWIYHYYYCSLSNPPVGLNTCYTARGPTTTILCFYKWRFETFLKHQTCQTELQDNLDHLFHLMKSCRQIIWGTLYSSLWFYFTDTSLRSHYSWYFNSQL